jgi:lipopolysaccharide export system permease protein
MGIAFRYVSRELLAVFFVTALVLLVIALGGRFMGYLQDAAVGKHSADALLKIIALRVPEFLQLTLPFSFYIALVLTAARLYADQEMTVLVTSGSSPSQVLLWIGVSALVVAAIVVYLSVQVTPHALGVLERFLSAERVEREFETMTPGVFHSFNDGARVTYSESSSADKRELSRVFIAAEVQGHSVTIWAQRGSQYIDAVTGSRFMLLGAGRRYEGEIGQMPYRVVKFEKLSQRIEQRDPALADIEIDAQPTSRLKRSDPRSSAELHWRYALPLMTLIAVPFGFVLARVRPREGRFARIVPAVLAFLAYYFVLLVNRNALASGHLSNAIGMWPTHATFAAVGVVLLRRLNRPHAD